LIVPVVIIYNEVAMLACQTLLQIWCNHPTV